MEMETQQAFNAVEKMIDEVPDGVNASTVAMMVVMDLSRLLVDEGSFTPEEVYEFVGIALKASTVMQ